MANIWIRKSLEQLMVETKENASGLKRTLGRFNLISLGIGGIIGAGIFVLTGQAAQVMPVLLLLYLSLLQE